jgi:DNA polymerase-3 subunit beta
VQRIPTADVRLRTTGDGQVAVLYARSRTLLQTFADSDLPPLPESTGPEAVASLNPGHLPRMARQTAFAVARDESRPILKGILLALGEGKALMVSTDGTRLSHTWAPVPELHDPPITFVLAARAVQEAARLAGTDGVELRFARNRLQFRTAAGTLTTLPLDGQFPDYKRVIPAEYPVTIRCDTDAFRGALERAFLVAHRDRAAAVRMEHRPGSLEISAVAQDVGQAVELLDVESTGDPITVWFNPTLLLDAVRSLEGEQMVLEFAGAQLPARFREYEGPAYFHIVLPLRHGV